MKKNLFLATVLLCGLGTTFYGQAGDKKAADFFLPASNKDTKGKKITDFLSFEPPYGPSMNKQNDSTKQLFIAANSGQTEKVKTLLKQGANPNYRNFKTRDEMHCGCSGHKVIAPAKQYAPTTLNNAHPATIPLLLKAGADVRMPGDNQGHSVFENVLRDAVYACTEFKRFYNPEKCQQYKLALKAMLASSGCKKGLTVQEAKEEGQKIRTFFNEGVSLACLADDQKAKQDALDEIMTVVLSEQEKIKKD